MKASLTNREAPVDYGRISLYILVIFLLAGAVSFIPSLTDRGNSSDLAAAGDFWQEIDDTDQSIAGVSSEAFHPVEPGPYLKSRADQLESFIGINTFAKQLYWFDNGQVAHTYPVLKIAGATAADTPTGQYEINYRSKRHLSSDGTARLPFTQQFVGNHAIHGWPTRLDGQPVANDFTGGSIWLSSGDAETVYDLATGGTPVVVTNEINEEAASTPPLPHITAKSYVIADVATGHVFARKAAHEKLSIASISKLMTAVVAEDHIGQDELIYISQNAINTYGRAGGLTAGQSLLYSTLQYPLLLDSSNDAATAIAEHLEYDRFIDLMNQKAITIGMDNTSFGDPSGLSAQNISTARDLFQLSRYLYTQRPQILDITTETFQTVPDRYSDALRNFTNNHPMAGRSNYRGGKNGYTNNARYTLLSIFRVGNDVARRDIAIIILGSENYTDDTQRLYEWVQRVI